MSRSLINSYSKTSYKLSSPITVNTLKFLILIAVDIPLAVELSDGSLVNNLFELPCSVLDVVVVFEFGDVCVVVDCFVVDLVEGAGGSALVVVVIMVGGTFLVVGSFDVDVTEVLGLADVAADVCLFVGTADRFSGSLMVIVASFSCR